MKGLEGRVLYAASDLMGFLGCRHSISLDLIDLQTPLEKAEDNAQARLIQERGLEHERHYLRTLQDAGLSIAEIPEDNPLQDRVAQTLDAMHQGVDVIYQAALWDAPWHGFANFIHRVNRVSALGDYSYEAIDCKLSQHPDPRHVLQLCVYSDLLETSQGIRPHTMSLVLGDGRKIGFRYNDFAYYYATINNLLAGIERVAIEQGVEFHGQKKSTTNQPETFFNAVLIEDITRNEQVVLHADLIAGTAWLFAREELDEALDYLFVDEAGQVSLANLIAMGTSARNLVLVGDQMQLEQPIQGVHPGESGTSTLEYLLQDHHHRST